jgi:hypothetical protein
MQKSKWQSGLHARLELRMLAFQRDDVFDLMRVLLFFELVGFLTDELLKRFECELVRAFTGLFFGMAKSRVKMLHFFSLVIGIFTRNGKRKRRDLSRALLGGPLVRSLFLNLPGRSAKVALHSAFFLLFHPLAEDIAILGVHLGQSAVSEALGIVHFRAPVGVALYHCIDAPLDVRRRPGLPSSEILFVFDLELADVFLKTAQVFVSRWHSVSGRLFRC